VVKWTDKAVEVTTGIGNRTCAVAKSGKVRCWGDNAWGTCGIGKAGKPVCVPGTAVLDLNNAVQIDAGSHHSCARTALGKVRCWGTSYFGGLGDGGAISHLNKAYSPRDVKGLIDAVDMSSAIGHVCAVRAKGSVVCWGNNAYGQIGDGSLSNRNAPAPVFGLSDAIAVSAGAQHTCALRKGGKVVCWGGNSMGQLGTGNTFKSIAPLPVADLDGVVAISAGVSHSCALRKNGELRCWGSNGFGELGTGQKGGIKTKPVTVVGSAP